VLLKLIVERPDNANQLFETISLELRKPPPAPEAPPVEPPVELAAPAPVDLPPPADAPPAEGEAAEPPPPEDGDAAAAAAAAAAEGEGEGSEAPKKKRAPAPPAKPLTPFEQKRVPWLEAQAKVLLPPKPKPEPVEGEEEPEPEAEPAPEDPGTAGQVSEVLDDATLWSAYQQLAHCAVAGGCWPRSWPRGIWCEHDTARECWKLTTSADSRAPDACVCVRACVRACVPGSGPAVVGRTTRAGSRRGWASATSARTCSSGRCSCWRGARGTSA
jgi:hypothetical protein